MNTHTAKAKGSDYVLMTYQPKQDNELNNTIAREVVKDIDDVKVGNVAYILLTNKAKVGNIVLCGEIEITERLEMFNDQQDILGTVIGHYIRGRFV